MGSTPVMDKKSMQKIWDDTLISHAICEMTMGTVFCAFFVKIGEYGGENPDWNMMKKRLVELNLRRCLDVNKERELIVNFGMKQLATDFIYLHSKSFAVAILERRIRMGSTDINPRHYKWKKKLVTQRMMKEKRARRYKRTVSKKLDRMIYARELNKKHDWNTVK